MSAKRSPYYKVVGAQSQLILVEARGNSKKVFHDLISNPTPRDNDEAHAKHKAQ